MRGQGAVQLQLQPKYAECLGAGLEPVACGQASRGRVAERKTSAAFPFPLCLEPNTEGLKATLDHRLTDFDSRFHLVSEWYPFPAARIASVAFTSRRLTAYIHAPELLRQQIHQDARAPHQSNERTGAGRPNGPTRLSRDADDA